MPANSSESYDKGVRAALVQLLELCPELIAAWEELRADWSDQTDPAEVGLYIIIGEVVKPALGRALGLPEDLLRDSRRWRDLLTPVTSQDRDLARRLYGVLEQWASSPSPEVVEAVRVEFAGGWAGWTQEVSLFGPAGPT